MPSGFDPFDPLGESADPRRYFPLATGERLLAEIAAKVRDGSSPILLAGPSGVGKTLLLRVLAERERLNGQRVAYSPFLNLPPDECARWLLHLLGIHALRGPQAEAALLEDLRTPGGRPTLVIVDEIQAAPEVSVRKLADLARAGRPALSVVVAGNQGRALKRRLSALAPEVTLRFPESLPEAEIGALCGAILGHPELSPELREALSPARDEIVFAASGLPRILKAELEVRAQNYFVLRGPRRRMIEELCLDTWQAPAPAPPAAAPAPPAAAPAPPTPVLAPPRPALAPSTPALATPRRAPAPLTPALAATAPAPSRQRAPELPRKAPLRPAARETIGAWASVALREAERARARCAASALRAGRAARAQREVARAWGTRAAREAGFAAGRVARGAGSALVAAGRVALPAAALCALALFLRSDHRTETRMIAAASEAAGAQLAALPAPEPAPLPSGAAEGAASLPLRVQAQINARPWARIRIDGVDVGPTPLSRPLAPGIYRIDAEFADGRSLQRHVEIGPEQRFVALP